MSSETAVAEAAELAPEDAAVAPELPANPPHVADDMATTAFADDAEVAVRSLDARVIEARIVPWGVTVDSPIGPEQFMPGSFAHVDPRKVVLTVEHKGAFGPPIGRGEWLEERSDGAYMGFKVSRTLHGDEGLQLAADGVTPHVSIVYHLPSSSGEYQYRSGRRATAWTKVDLREVATTWKPYYPTADVTAVRSVQEGDATVATETSEPKAPEPVPAPPAPDPEPEQSRSFDAAFGSFEAKLGSALEGVTDRLAAIEERSRSQFVIPGETPADNLPDVGKGNWLQYALRAMSGDRISTADEQYRALADVITSDNLGVVPDSFSSELIGVIDPSRPFLSSTRKLPTPSSGMTMHVPKITQRPLVGIQSDEKGDVQSRETHITDETFNAVTKAGGGDLSLQILKRSDPSFLDLYLRLLAEAYAIDTEAEAIEALLAEGTINDGLTLNPAETGLGDAFVTSFDAIRRGPDTIWLSSAAVGAFIDAVSPVTGMPMYSSITADFTVPGGINGTIKGLRPVHVPELGAQGADVIIGPSSGFAWAEDGTYTLQVDVPAKAGRDVALVGILWFAPYYPSAFSVYTLES